MTTASKTIYYQTTASKTIYYQLLNQDLGQRISQVSLTEWVLGLTIFLTSGLVTVTAVTQYLPL